MQQTTGIESKQGVTLKCPVCKAPELRVTDLEDGLRFRNCLSVRETGSGVGVLKWLEGHGPNLPERSEQDSGLALAEPVSISIALSVVSG